MNTRLLLGRAGTAAAGLVRAVRIAVVAFVVLLTAAPLAQAAQVTPGWWQAPGGGAYAGSARHLNGVTRAGDADRRTADHSVTVIATRDGRPMAVAVDFPFIAQAAGSGTLNGGAATVPGTGIGHGQLLGTPDRIAYSTLARAPASSPI